MGKGDDDLDPKILSAIKKIVKDETRSSSKTRAARAAAGDDAEDEAIDPNPASRERSRNVTIWLPVGYPKTCSLVTLP